MRNRIIKDVLKLLSKKNMQLVAVESCSGGLVASALTEISGASKVFWGGYVLYSNIAKSEVLGVKEEVLNKFGAVSKECVDMLLENSLDISKCDISVAVSGIAGPTGGTIDKPVGTVFLGVAKKNGDKIVEKFLFSGNRKSIRKQSVVKLLKMVKKII